MRRQECHAKSELCMRATSIFCVGEDMEDQITGIDRWKSLQQGNSHTLELEWSGQVKFLQLAASHNLVFFYNDMKCCLVMPFLGKFPYRMNLHILFVE